MAVRNPDHLIRKSLPVSRRIGVLAVTALPQTLTRVDPLLSIAWTYYDIALLMNACITGLRRCWQILDPELGKLR